MAARYKYGGLFTARALQVQVARLRKAQHKQVCPVLQSRTQEAIATLKADRHHCKKGKLSPGILLERIIDIGKQAIVYFEAWCRAEAETASAKLRVVNLLESRAVAEKQLNVVMGTKNVLKDTIDSLESKVYNAEEKLHNTENARLNLVTKCEVLQALAEARKIQIAALETMLVQALRFNGAFDNKGVLESMQELVMADCVLPQACDLLDEGKGNEE